MREEVERRLEGRVRPAEREELISLIERQPDPFLTLAVIRRESDFRPGLVMRSTGARGLAQVLPMTFREHARTMGMASLRIDDPVHNVLVGADYLFTLVSRFGLEMGIAAYGWGPGSVSRALREKRPIPSSVRAYVRDVVRFREEFKRNRRPSGCWKRKSFSQPCFGVCYHPKGDVR